MKFKRETGAIISSSNLPIAYFMGSAGHVDFDPEVVTKIHQLNPGLIWKFAHIHPDGMTNLSNTDKSFLRTWASAMYPFPVRLTIITAINLGVDVELEEHSYVAMMESKAEWKKSERPFRNIEIIKEEKRVLDEREQWVDYLISQSYE